MSEAEIRTVKTQLSDLLGPSATVEFLRIEVAALSNYTMALSSHRPVALCLSRKPSPQLRTCGRHDGSYSAARDAWR